MIGADDKPVEHTVKTVIPERGFRGITLQDRIDRIRANNRQDGYCRKRSDVEEEIRIRQEQCSEPSSLRKPIEPPEEPPGSPRRKKIN